MSLPHRLVVSVSRDYSKVKSSQVKQPLIDSVKHTSRTIKHVNIE